jgi:hypothetical protein
MDCRRASPDWALIQSRTRRLVHPNFLSAQQSHLWPRTVKADALAPRLKREDIRLA